jgi:hypothetical protein
VRITFDEPDSPKGKKGMLVCPICHMRAIRLVETAGTDLEAVRGAVQRIRTFECTSPGCGYETSCVEICLGPTTKRRLRYERGSAERRQSVGDLISVEVFPATLIVKA